MLHYPPRPSNPHFRQRQQLGFCTIHAINNMLGFAWIDPYDVLRHAKAMTHTLNELRHPDRDGWNSAYNPHSGWFDLTVINHYLYYNASIGNATTHPNKRLVLKYAIQNYGGNREQPHTKASTLAALSPEARGLGFTVHMNSRAHAYAVRLENGQWRIADSEDTPLHGQTLTDTNWHTIEGHIVQLGTISTQNVGEITRTLGPFYHITPTLPQPPQMATQATEGPIEIDLTQAATPTNTETPSPRNTVPPRQPPSRPKTAPTRPPTTRKVDAWKGHLNTLTHLFKWNTTALPVARANQDTTIPLPNQTQARTLHIVTHNVRGLLSQTLSNGAPGNLSFTLCNIAEWAADIVVLTETKLSGKHDYLKKAFLNEGYRIYCSTVTRSTAERGTAGVAIAVTTRYSRLESVVHHTPPPLLHGYVSHIQIRTRGSTPLTVLGIYAPEDTATRKAIYHYCQNTLTRTTACGQHLVMAGDFNAVAQAADRTGPLDAADRLHQSFLKTTEMRPARSITTAVSAWSYEQTQLGAVTHRSRIDDILLCPTTQAACPNATERTSAVAGNFDHRPVHVELPADALQLWEAPQPAPPPTNTDTSPSWARVTLPITQKQLAAAAIRLEDALVEATADLHLATKAATQVIDNALRKHMQDPMGYPATRMHEDLEKSRILQNVDIDRLADRLTAALDTGLKCLLDECTMRPPHTGKYHQSRSTTRRLKPLWDEEVLLKQELTNLTSNPTLDDASTTRIEKLRARIKECQAEHRQLVADRAKTQREAAAAALQHTLATRPAQGHKRIFQKNDAERGLPAVRDPVTNTVVTDAAGILDALESHFRKLTAPPRGTRTGEYRLDANETRGYPFELPGATDPFSLERNRHPDAHTMLSSMSDPATFDQCISHLSRNKAAGPDGVPNELLRILPPGMKRALHNMIKIMYVRSTIPATWATSDTVLLPKPGDALDIKNKRPIVLANTCYKLYTSMLTLGIGELAGPLQLFSEAQEGFRAYCNTERQILNLVHVLEDAALYGKDVYAVYVDYSSAFNTIDQDRLLQIMFDLGLPNDLIRAVRNLYAHATTRIRTEHGCTSPIPIERGTVQGDTLSPVLFILFMEPLMRWMHVGGRGYRYGCLSPEENDRYHCSAAAYADDLAALTNTLEDLHIQCDKISAYAEWAGLRVNHTKCAATAIWHNKSRSCPSLDGPTGNATLAAMRRDLTNTVRIGNTSVPYYPPTKPYKYLGIQLTFSLDWKAQAARAMEIVKEKGTAIATSLATPGQRLRMLQQCVHSSVAYAFAAMPYTKQDIATLDTTLAGYAKKCYGLPRSFPTRTTLLSVEEYGLGLGSLLPQYARVAHRALVLALNDDGRLGAVTRALLPKQHSVAGTSAAHHIPADRGRRFVTLQQMTLAREHGIQLYRHGAPFTTPTWSIVEAIDKTATIHDTAPLPIEHVLPLAELQLELSHLVDRNTGRHLITSKQLEQRLGTHRVRHRHKVALNRLSLALSDPGTPLGLTTTPERHTSPEPLESSKRAIAEHAQLHSLLTRKDPPPPGMVPSLTPFLQPSTPTVPALPMYGHVDIAQDTADSPIYHNPQAASTTQQPGEADPAPPTQATGIATTAAPAAATVQPRARPRKTPVQRRAAQPAEAAPRRITKHAAQRRRIAENTRSTPGDLRTGDEAAVNSALRLTNGDESLLVGTRGYETSRSVFQALTTDMKQHPHFGAGLTQPTVRSSPGRRALPASIVSRLNANANQTTSNAVLEYVRDRQGPAAGNGAAEPMAIDPPAALPPAQPVPHHAVQQADPMDVDPAPPARPARAGRTKPAPSQWRRARHWVVHDLVPIPEDGCTNSDAQLTYSLDNDGQELQSVLHSQNQQTVTDLELAKRRKTGQGTSNTREKYFTVTWKPTVTPPGLVSAFVRMGYATVTNNRCYKHPLQARPSAHHGAQGQPAHALPVNGSTGRAALFSSRSTRLLRHITWAPSTDRESDLKDNPDWEELLADCNARLAAGPTAPTRTQPAPKDGHLSARQRQGRHTPETDDTAARARAIRSTTAICTSPCNPYTDVQPTGSYAITTQTTAQPGAAPAEVHVFDPTGRWLGSLTYLRLQTLWERFQRVNHRARAFEEAVAALIHRYRRDPDQTDRKAAPQHQTTLPTTTTAAAVRALRNTRRGGTVIERFASPLNCTSEADAYYSRDPADAAFGAKHDAYSTAWTGLNYCHPPATPEAARKALLWALACAEAMHANSEPTLTILVLPKCASFPHTQWFSHPLCLQLATWSAGAAGTPGTPGMEPGLGTNATWDKQKGAVMVAVGNPAGLHAFGEGWKGLRSDLANGPHKPLKVGPTQLTWSDTPNTECPRIPLHICKHAKYLTEHPVTVQGPPAATPRPARFNGAQFQRKLQLAHIPDDIVWTDGSVSKTTTRAGNEVQISGACAWHKKRTVYVNPNGHGCTNTITRAELAAIHAALLEFGGENSTFAKKTLTIASDSAASLYLIKKAINEPRRLHLSKHRALLSSIVDALHARTTRGANTVFLKVVSHTGLHGNEEADKGAAEAAAKTKPIDVTEHADNNPHAAHWWPTRTITREDGSTVDHYISDLNRGLLKALNPASHGGHAKHTLYTTKWADAAPQLDTRASTAYMTHCGAGHGLRRFIQIARQGGMICPARLALYKLRNSDMCTLCAPIQQCKGAPPERGTAGHVAGHCAHPQLVGARIAKHNAAVRMIAECIHQGTKGGGYMLMDASTADARPEYCAGSCPPSWMLSGANVPDADRKRMRPDILFIPTLPRTDVGARGPLDMSLNERRNHKVYLIEVGYTSDLHHSEK
jgi:exonuclease III/ribonuclease HI